MGRRTKGNGCRSSRSTSWSAVTDLVATEALIGVVYTALGMAMLFALEVESRRHASLELA